MLRSKATAAKWSEEQRSCFFFGEEGGRASRAWSAVNGQAEFRRRDVC